MRRIQLSLLGALTTAVTSMLLGSGAAAQDNILIYGNSIIDGVAPLYLEDIIIQAGHPAPNLVTDISGDQSTADYLANQGLISSSLPAGETWKAVIVQGATFETTTQFGYDPLDFRLNMIALAAHYYAHSPQGLFIGHETGADHPNSNRYPALFPDAATWLGLSKTAYATAQGTISTIFPGNPPMRVAPQGTAFANTAGYGLGLFRNDLHHHSTRGKILDAALHYQAIYGGLLCDIDVDFSQSTPLIQRLLSNNIDEAGWNRIAGFADRSLPQSERPYAGSESDFQLRMGINTTNLHLCTEATATAGDTLNVRPFSPLGAALNFSASVYIQILPTGTSPAANGITGLYLDPQAMRVHATFLDLNASAAGFVIPAGLAGQTLWIQSISRAPSGNGSFPFALSDAKLIHIQ